MASSKSTTVPPMMPATYNLACCVSRVTPEPDGEEIAEDRNPTDGSIDQEVRMGPIGGQHEH